MKLARNSEHSVSASELEKKLVIKSDVQWWLSCSIELWPEKPRHSKHQYPSKRITDQRQPVSSLRRLVAIRTAVKFHAATVDMQLIVVPLAQVLLGRPQRAKPALAPVAASLEPCCKDQDLIQLVQADLVDAFSASKSCSLCTLLRSSKAADDELQWAHKEKCVAASKCKPV